MGRYVTPRGVVIETTAEAARVVGYRPADEEPKQEQKKAPAKKRTSSKKSD